MGIVPSTRFEMQSFPHFLFFPFAKAERTAKLKVNPTKVMRVQVQDLTSSYAKGRRALDLSFYLCYTVAF